MPVIILILTCYKRAILKYIRSTKRKLLMKVSFLILAFSNSHTHMQKKKTEENIYRHNYKANLQIIRLFFSNHVRFGPHQEYALRENTSDL